MLDVVAAPQEQRYEDGVGPAQAVQGVGEQRPVQLDVAEPDVEPGAQLADPVQEREDGPQGPRVAAAVGDDEEGGRGVAGGVRGGRAACCGGGRVRSMGRRVPFRETRLSWVESWAVTRVRSCAVLSRGTVVWPWVPPVPENGGEGGCGGRWECCVGGSVMDRWCRAEVAGPLREGHGGFPPAHGGGSAGVRAGAAGVRGWGLPVCGVGPAPVSGDRRTFRAFRSSGEVRPQDGTETVRTTRGLACDRCEGDRKHERYERYGSCEGCEGPRTGDTGHGCDGCGCGSHRCGCRAPGGADGSPCRA